ncbi:MAG: hypothetical protein GY869_21920, partial [Planctomycetes bacterium]|nr:hypothetical protein [Planctomycetota bacterium]
MILTMVVRRGALAWGFVDRPGERKIHVSPIPLGGGIVIFWVTMLPILLVMLFAGYCEKFGIPDW